MSEVNLSSATRAILDAARKDGPSVTARAKVWGGVSSAVGGAAAAGGAISAATATAGGMGAAKMLALGTLLGGTLSVGLAATVLYVGHARGGAERAFELRAASAAEVGHEKVAAVATSECASAPVSTAASTSAPSSMSMLTSTAAGKRPMAPVARPAARVPVDALAREASLVASARSSLASGDPRTALQSIHDTRVLSSRQLEPEELTVEAQALRALGRQHEANEADSALRAQFPESALAR